MKTYSDIKRDVEEWIRQANAVVDAADGDLTGSDAERFDRLTEQIRDGQQEMQRLEFADQMANQARDRSLDEIRAAGAAEGRYMVERGSNSERDGDTGAYSARSDRGGRRRHRDPWNVSEIRLGGDQAAEMRSRACDAIERMSFAEDNVREAATRFVERDGVESAPVAQLVLATTSPSYERAFIKLIKSRGNAAGLTGDEAEAYSRAMSLTDVNGGFLVPFQLDPTVILTANGSSNPVRQLAKVVTATGDVWNGVSSAGVTGSWDGEAEEVSDDAPSFAQPSIPVHKLQIFVPLSHEAQMDAYGIADTIAEMIAFEKEVKESTAFVTGSGTGQPTGIITDLMGTSSVINSITTDTLALADVYALDSALPQRYAANASWLAHRAIYNRLRQFDTAGGAALWGYLNEAQKRDLLGRPDYISEAMDNTITAGQDNPALLFGDFRNYVIADRLGTQISYIPHLFGANGRPTGQAGWHSWIRVGGDVVNRGAFRLLNVT
ncbi:phage major capsid protein [Mycolicibacterium sp. jd]|uniref:phage major capsid protein n=1 Tax=unclassified Mycolicibacterium TaxID=2636767 RepID=UPI00351B359F